MKYGVLSFGRNNAQGKNQYGNLGDYYQSFAVEQLYKNMGIPQDEISRIKRTEISSYRGEKTKLLLQGCFLHLKGAPVFPVSPDIEPVFFGFHCLSIADRRMIKKLPDDAVIGCRDEPTFRLMQKLGKKAYISGCLTATLERRKNEPKNGKVFLVDAPENIVDFMPENLKEKIEYISQSFLLSPQLSDDETFAALRKKAQETLARYRDEAQIVVTSRLHVASPCTAMGIPVILVRNYFDERYAWLDKYLPFYTPDRFGEIDWNFKVPDIEQSKKMISQAAAAAVNHSADAAELAERVHDFYMSRTRQKISKPFYTKAYHFMQGTFPKTADFVREVLLKKFTVDTSREKEINH